MRLEHHRRETPGMKIPKQLTQRHLTIGSLVLLILMIAVTVMELQLNGLTKIAFVDVFLVGWNMASAFYSYLRERADAREQRLIAVCDEQQKMLQAFIENRVQMHFMGMMQEPGETPPTAPRLH